MPSESLAPAVFLDRDGTLMEEVHYCRDPGQVCLLPGVAEGLIALREAGFCLILVTNQSGLGRGWITVAEYEAVHARLLQLLPAGVLQATYMCPDAPGVDSARRKPAAGMIYEAANEHSLSLSHSWLIGDKASDVHCALNAGVRPILLQTGYGAAEVIPAGLPRMETFAGAVQLILASR